jgi:cytochrome P450
MRTIFDPDTYVSGVPHDLFAQLRREAPVAWVDEPATGPLPAGPGFLAVLRHADVEHVLRTPRVFSSWLGLTQIYDAPPPFLPYARKQMINMDPPEHARIRGLLTRSFTPRAVAKLEGRIQERAYQLVDAALEKFGRERGECDFAKDIAPELPLLTLADLLGVPESDRWLMYDWANRVIGLLDEEYSVSNTFDPAAATDMAQRALKVRPPPGQDPRTPSGMADLYAYAKELGEYRRSNPGDDVMSILLQQLDGAGDRVGPEEFENVFWLFSVAGNETVRNALPGGMLALLENPAEYRRLRDDPSLLPGAVEEMLRWWTPVIHFRRTAAADTEIAGTVVERGQKVVVFFSSANRDEAVFKEPDRFDITRDPNPHLAFGHGAHFCIAAQLARKQMVAMFAAVIDRLGEVEPAGDPVRLRSNFQNGVKRLPIRWRRP